MLSLSETKYFAFRACISLLASSFVPRRLMFLYLGSGGAFEVGGASHDHSIEFCISEAPSSLVLDSFVWRLYTFSLADVFVLFRFCVFRGRGIG